MEAVLLDTDVFSLFFRRDTRSLLYDPDVRGKVRCLSFASVAELRFGAIVAGWQDRRRQQLEEAIARTVILHGDDLTVQHWAQTKAARQRSGRPIGSEDCWVAATALRHGLVLLTHNARDYSDIKDLQIVSHRS
jgi:predicted nucleic acid-binding protein